MIIVPPKIDSTCEITPFCTCSARQLSCKGLEC